MKTSPLWLDASAAAAKLGVSRATLFRRFGGKDALFEAALARALRGFLEEIGTAFLTVTDPVERIETAFVACLRFRRRFIAGNSDPAHGATLVAMLSTGDPSPLELGRRFIAARIVAGQAEGVLPAADADIQADAIIRLTLSYLVLPSALYDLDDIEVARSVARMGLRFVVLTGVARDDLPDGGAAIWAETVRQVRRAVPGAGVEVLPSDFKGGEADIATVLESEPDVFAHNLETVPRLSREVRVQASYPRSYTILEHAKRRGAITKTGLMLGLGETLDEVREVLRDLRRIGVDILTLGQYLRPSKQHLEIARYVPPEEFALLGAEARALGFPHVESGPLVRSSYHADEHV